MKTYSKWLVEYYNLLGKTQHKWLVNVTSVFVSLEQAPLFGV